MSYVAPAFHPLGVCLGLSASPGLLAVLGVQVDAAKWTGMGMGSKLGRPALGCADLGSVLLRRCYSGNDGMSIRGALLLSAVCYASIQEDNH